MSIELVIAPRGGYQARLGSLTDYREQGKKELILDQGTEMSVRTTTQKAMVVTEDHEFLS